MIELILSAILLVSVIGLCISLTRRDARARVILPGEPIDRPRGERIPWHEGPVPIDATHIAWIMLGEGDQGRVHTLLLQTLENLADEVQEARSPWGPIIVHSITLECDIRSRGCVPVSEVMYAIARVDAEGNEWWMGRRGEWTSRWSDRAKIYECFPGQVR